MNMNYVNLVGNVVSDAEVSTGANGKEFAKFRVAVNREVRKAGQEQVTDFFNVVVFNEQTAAFAKSYMKKGTSCFVIGTLRNDNYKDKDGNAVYSYTVFADSIGFANGEHLNMVTFEGRLARDPEVRYTTGENSMCIARYSVAVGRGTAKDKDACDFISVTTMGKAAENIEKYLSKGSSVCIVGSVNFSEYTDKDGIKRRTSGVVSNRVIFGKKKSESAGDTNAPAPEDSNQISIDDDGFMNIDSIDEDELPFN